MGRRGRVQLIQAGENQIVALGQQVNLLLVGAAVAADQVPGQLFGWLGHFGHGFDFCHARAALEGVQGAMHAVVHRVLGQVGVIAGQPLGDQCQVAAGLAGKDFQQDGVRAFVAIIAIRGRIIPGSAVAHVRNVGQALGSRSTAVGRGLGVVVRFLLWQVQSEAFVDLGKVVVHRQHVDVIAAVVSVPGGEGIFTGGGIKGGQILGGQGMLAGCGVGVFSGRQLGEFQGAVGLAVRIGFQDEGVRGVRADISDSVCGGVVDGVGGAVVGNDHGHLIDLATGGQGVGGIGQRLHVKRVRLAQGKGIDQGGYAIANFLDQGDQHGSGHNGAVDNPVQHVFYGPAQFPHGAGTDHAAGAFQGVEGAAEFHQGFFVAGVGSPAREVFVQGVQYFAHFFLEDLDDFVIDQIVVIVVMGVGV